MEMANSARIFLDAAPEMCTPKYFWLWLEVGVRTYSSMSIIGNSIEVAPDNSSAAIEGRGAHLLEMLLPHHHRQNDP